MIASFPKEENTVLVQHTEDLILRMLVQLKLERLETLYPVSLPFFEAPLKSSDLVDRFLPCFRIICELIQLSQVPLDNSSETVLQYIDQHLSDPGLCIDQLKEEFKISSGTLQRLVKDKTGLSCASYIERNRLNKAYELLSKGLNVQEVAKECGFNSHNTFFKAFKRFYGCAPTHVSFQNTNEK